MLRIFLVIFRSLFVLPVWFYNICRLGKSTTNSEQERYDYLRKITIKGIKRGRITIDCHGIENIPEENGYILYPNHQGLFDALSFLQTHEHPFAVVMKKEVKDIFVLKQIIRLMRCQIIDREDVKQSLGIIHAVGDEVKNGRNYIIFAEGTRSRKGNEIGSFKGGSFKSAYYAKCPIIPVALINSFLPFDSNSIKKTVVHIHYLKPIPYDDYKNMKSVALAEMVEEQIRDCMTTYLK